MNRVMKAGGGERELVNMRDGQFALSLSLSPSPFFLFTVAQHVCWSMFKPLLLAVLLAAAALTLPLELFDPPAPLLSPLRCV